MNALRRNGVHHIWKGAVTTSQCSWPCRATSARKEAMWARCGNETGNGRSPDNGLVWRCMNAVHGCYFFLHFWVFFYLFAIRAGIAHFCFGGFFISLTFFLYSWIPFHSPVRTSRSLSIYLYCHWFVSPFHIISLAVPTRNISQKKMCSVATVMETQLFTLTSHMIPTGNMFACSCLLIVRDFDTRPYRITNRGSDITQQEEQLAAEK